MSSELRTEVFIIAADRCEWPQCSQPATELAHLTSKGMGGSKHRDTVENTMAACAAHARISDGLPPPGGGLEDRNREYIKVPGAYVRGSDGYGTWRTRDVIEALRTWLAIDRKRRNWLTQAQTKLD